MKSNGIIPDMGKDSTSENLATAATAAVNAAVAAAAASTAASHAADNAAAAALASTSAATANAVTANDIATMKGNIAEIKEILGGMSKSFVPYAEFIEVKKMGEDHETRIRADEKNRFTQMGAFTIINAVVMIAITLLIKFVK
jgi:hypothetical protein